MADDPFRIPPRPQDPDLLERVVRHLRAHPDGWAQNYWRSPGGMCVAGWIVKLSGGRWLTGPDSQFSEEVLYEPEVDGLCGYHSSHPSRALVTRMEVRAPAVLGIYRHWADGLFRGDNTLDQLDGFVVAMREGRAA